MVTDCSYIDTRPGQGGFFSPPEAVENYADWLRARYEASKGSGRAQCYGLAQRINAMQAHQRTFKTGVRAFGPYAGTAAQVLEEITEGKLIVEVLG